MSNVNNGESAQGDPPSLEAAWVSADHLHTLLAPIASREVLLHIVGIKLTLLGLLNAAENGGHGS